MNQPEWNLKKSHVREGWLTLTGPYTMAAINAIKKAFPSSDREWCSSQSQRFFRVKEHMRETVLQVVAELEKS